MWCLPSIALLLTPVTPALGQSYWIGAAGDYNVGVSWSSSVPGMWTTAIVQNNSNNVCMIQRGDPAWTHWDMRVADDNGTSGKVVQAGSTNNCNNGAWFRLGDGSGAVGYYILSNGVVNVFGGLVNVGERGIGYLEVDNGVFSGSGNFNFGSYGGSDGTLIMNGGTVNSAGEMDFGIIGAGHLIVHGGSLNVSNALVIGRGDGNTGHGDFYMDGGVINKDSTGFVALGEGGGSCTGTITQVGGIFNSAAPIFLGWNGAGTWNLNGGTAALGEVWLGISASGSFNLNGGNLTASWIHGNNNANSVFNFNGGILHAGATTATWLTGLSAAYVQSGGAVIDTAGYSVIIGQPLLAGGGGLTKLGSGTLLLNGVNTYTGTTAVNAGELTGLTGGSCSNSSVTVANGATNGVQVAPNAGYWACSDLTYSAGTTYLHIEFSGTNPSVAIAPLLVNGNLTLTGTTLNVIIGASGAVGVGVYPLVKYNGILAGIPPTTAYSLPFGMRGSISNDVANKSLDLVVTTAGTGGGWLGAVAAVFSDNMVLQRGMPLPVWGSASPGQTVSVTFGGQTQTTTAGADQKWMVRLDAMVANPNSQPLTITISGTTTNVYNNVVVGDVWLASGQSNMDGNKTSVGYAANSAAEIAAANYPLIRSMKVTDSGAIAPALDATLSRTWTVCSPATVSSWSASAYFFARDLFQKTNVPIGILESAYDGTPAEAWTSLAALAAVPELQTLANQELAQYYQGSRPIQNTAGGLFNSMISPLIPFAIRGAIWYQGEANASSVNQCQQYRVLLPALIQDWRSRWQQAGFPFYIVQLTSMNGLTFFPYLREAQMLTLQTATNTGLAVIIDVGDPNNIHPLDKQDVGARLANLALNRNYGFTNVVPSGPIFRTYTTETNQIRLYFDYAEGGLMTGQKNGVAPLQELVGVAPNWFEIAGSNQTYYPATAYIDTNNTVVVSSLSVPNPTLARYAWSTTPMGTNLYNRAGLPASPFRIPVCTNSHPLSTIQTSAGYIQSVCAVPTNVTWWVEFSGSLAGPIWIPLVLPQTGTGSVQTVTDPTSGHAQRFYRWCQVP